MVEGVRPGGTIGGVVPAREAPRGAGGRFAVESGVRPLARNAGLSGAALIGMDSMLALQAVDEAQERDRRARKKGTAMLAALSDLQRTLIASEDPGQALRSLRDLTTEPGEDAADPELGAILRAVTLRARVEIARREMIRETVAKR